MPPSELDIGPGSIDALVLVGGTSMIPAVRNFVQDVVGTDADPNIDPMTAIAEGAAVAAAILSGENTDNEFFVSTEHALGTFALDGNTGELAFSEIIPKSHKLPARATQSYSPVHEEQTAVNIDVVEGDPEIGDFVVLKQWSVELAPSQGERAFDLTYDYDISGILSVVAIDQTSGATLLQDDVAYGVAADRSQLARVAQDARNAVSQASLTLDGAPTTSGLQPESLALIQKAEQLVLPYLEPDSSTPIENLIVELRDSTPESEPERREDLRIALQPYSFLL